MIKLEKWIDSREGLLMLIKDGDLATCYQEEYLDCPEEWEEDEIENGPLDYEMWKEWFLEEQNFFQSPEYQAEMDRLSEKD